MSATHPKCLLVDDDESMLAMLAQCVELLGFEPILAHDGDEGYSVFREQQPSLVVSDIHMPNRNGLLLLHDIKSTNPNVPVILITGYLHYRAMLKLETERPDAFMEKPFTLDRLRETVNKLNSAIEQAWKTD